MAGQKMSSQQKVLLLEWLERPENRWAQNTHIRENTQHKVTRKWEEIATILNSCRFGGKKVGEKWRKTFKEMRSHIRKKHRTYVTQKKAGHKHASPLSEVDTRYLNLFQTTPEDEVTDLEVRAESPATEERTPNTENESTKDENPRLGGKKTVEMSTTNTEAVWVHRESDDNFTPKIEDEISWPDTDEEKLSSPKYHRNKKKKSPESNNVKKEQRNFESNHLDHYNETDYVAQGWGIKLKRLDCHQRLLAEKFINDVIFEAEMGNLHRNAITFNLPKST